MKRLLLAMALVLVITIPAFAQNWVGPVDPEVQNGSVGINVNYGPLKIKPLMAYTGNEGGGYTPWFYVGDVIRSYTNWEMKGTGKFRLKVETRNSAGVLIDRVKFGWPDPMEVSSEVFQHWTSMFYLNPGLPATPGYYTVKAIYIDADRGSTWSIQTKIHVQEVPAP